jgi:hypothetical protein
MPIATPQGTLDFKSVDKVTFVGASSNTVIDTTTGSLGVGVGVGGPTSNLHVVGDALITGNVSDLNVVSNVNMLHTSNTASVKLNSNVVAEFPRSKKLVKYPRVAMTANSSGGYVSSASTVLNSTLEAWYVFDTVIPEGSTVSRWRSANSVYTNNSVGSPAIVGTAAQLSASSGTPSGEYILVTLPEKMCLKRYSWSGMTTQGPKDGEIWGSNDGSSWSHVHTFTDGNSGWVSAGSSTSDYGNYPDHRDVGEGNVAFYSRYAFIITKLAGGDIAASMRDLQYFGTPEYDPDAHGTDVTVKSYPNVPNTDWLEVYYDAKDLADGTVSTTAGAITGLGGTTNNGTAYGNPQISDGAFVLDGVDDYITTAQLGFSGDQPYSISIWFRSDKPQIDMTTEHGIYGFGYGNNLYAGLSWWSPVTNGTASLRHWHSGSAGKNFPYVTFLEDMWNHVVIVYPGGGAFNIRAWLNGVERMGVNGTGSGGVNNDFNWSTSDTVVIGDWYNGSSVRGQSPWDGKIANFRIFNRALTIDEIYQLYAYQKEDFGHGDLSMTLKAGRLGIGTSEPRAALDVRGRIMREYNPGEIIEELNSICDGSTVAVLSGSYKMANVTAGQDGTASYATITGSTIIYTPPPGTKRVYYRFWYHFMGVSESAISHHKIQVDGNDIYGSASCIASQYSTPHDHANFPVSVEYTMQIDMSSNDVNKGQFTSWTGPKTIRVMFREYNGSSYQCKLHENEWWDGGGASGNYLIMKPHLTIRAIA